MIKNKKQLKKSYDLAKTKKVGQEVECPSCRYVFVKRSYQQTFCGRFARKCNDNYWNNVDCRKFNNTTRISPANRDYAERRERNDYLYDDHPFSTEGLGQW